METVKINVTSMEKASRLELFIRFIWGFIAGIILFIIGIFALYIATPIQWLHILFLGKRHPALAKFINSWFAGMAQLYFYMLLATDERPPLVPAL